MTENTHRLLSPDELDTIGEIMNISMGAAATAVSNMLEKQVTITTPVVEQDQFCNIDSSGLEPALMVRINYVQGIKGLNVMMFRRHDMQVILDLLMGNELSDENDDFEFDEMSMSAACEVMNQMMGASATALSEIMERPINISTPEAVLANNRNEICGHLEDEHDQGPLVDISFKMMIKGVLDTTFSCLFSTSFAQEIINYVSGSIEETPEPIEEPAAPQISDIDELAPSFLKEPAAPAAPVSAPAAPAAPTAPVQPAAPQAPVYQEMPPMEPFQPQPVYQPPVVPAPAVPPAPAAAYAAPNLAPDTVAPPAAVRPPMQFDVVPQQPMYSQQMPYAAAAGGYPGYPQYPYAPQQMGYATPPQNIQNAEFPDFSKQPMRANMPAGSNMNLLMGVQLEVSVVIGRTKQKIKDVMDFGQGTVLELDKQTGAPAEIMVNGQLLAYGDVIVVGDNFGIRITEIVGTKELLNSLDSNL